MLRPKRDKEPKIKLTKEGIQKAKGIFGYIKKYRLLFLIGWLFLLLSSISMIFFPYLMGQLVGSIGGTKVMENPSIARFDIENINSIVILLFVLFGVQAVFSFFRVVIFTNVTENVLRDMRKAAFERLIFMPMDFFNRQKVGELTSRISSDITQIQETLRTTLAEFFRQVVTIMGSVVFLVMISWKLALIMVGTVPVMALIAVFFGRFIRSLSKGSQDASAVSNSILEESLMGISNVKSFTNEIFMLRKYQKSIDEIRSLNVKSGLWRGLFVSFIIFCMTGAIVFIVWQGILMTQGLHPELTAKGFSTFVMFTIMMVAAVGSIPDLYANIQKSIGATENLMYIIHEKNERELHTGTQFPMIKGEVRFENVHFSYPQRKEVSVLKGITFSVALNDTVALVGASGAGKSTISSLLLNYYSVEDGAILFDGTNCRDIDTEHLRKHLAIVPQEVILFAGTIHENIAFGRPDASENEIWDAALQANAIEFISAFPDGMQTQVGDRGIQLSGGQKQRIAIARAILRDPLILILDEATSALDSESERLVQDALDKLMFGRTSFVIAHRLSTVRKADKILVLDQGSIAEEGTHEELITRNGLYSNLVELQTMLD
jgi:ABC-type multidrug transport system fused ATPase/permease subunit